MPIANPFSRFLRTRLADAVTSGSSGIGVAGDTDSREDSAAPVTGVARETAELEAFARYWDDVETLIIQVYRRPGARRADRRDWLLLREDFEAMYAAVADTLEPHWRGVLAGGAPLNADPFRSLLDAESARAFADDWNAMQRLPAAREALNRRLLALSTLVEGRT